MNKNKTLVNHINNTLLDWLKEDNKGIIIGEDILDPYGGAFKVTKGISSTYPDRLINTPISESLISGMLIGLSLEGMHPCGEIMFGDFMSLTFSQMFDNAEKYYKMFNGQVEYPFVLRTPMGGGRGYGATHSQSIEKVFSLFQYIDVIAINNYKDNTYKNCFDFYNKPVIIIENKWLYGQELITEKSIIKKGLNIEESNERFCSYYFSFEKPESDILTIITYGPHFSSTLDLVYNEYINSEKSIGIVLLTNLSNIDFGFISNHICSENKVLIIEDGHVKQGIGSEIISILSEKNNVYKRLGARDIVIPSALQLEKEVIVTSSRIKSAINSFI